jgi:hypothetical protein
MPACDPDDSPQTTLLSTALSPPLPRSTLDPVLRREQTGLDWRGIALLAVAGLYLTITPGAALQHPARSAPCALRPASSLAELAAGLCPGSKRPRRCPLRRRRAAWSDRLLHPGPAAAQDGQGLWHGAQQLARTGRRRAGPRAQLPALAAARAGPKACTDRAVLGCAPRRRAARLWMPTGKAWRRELAVPAGGPLRWLHPPPPLTLALPLPLPLPLSLPPPPLLCRRTSPSGASWLWAASAQCTAAS